MYIVVLSILNSTEEITEWFSLTNVKIFLEVILLPKARFFLLKTRPLYSFTMHMGRIGRISLLAKITPELFIKKRIRSKKREAQRNRDGGTGKFVVDEDEHLEYVEGSDSDEYVVDIQDTVDTPFEETRTRVVNNSDHSRGQRNV